MRARGAGIRKSPFGDVGSEARRVSRRVAGVVGAGGRSVSLRLATLMAMLAMLGVLVVASAARADTVPISASLVEVHESSDAGLGNGYVNCAEDLFIQFSAVQDVTSYHAEIDDASRGHRFFDGPPFDDAQGYFTKAPAPAGTHRFAIDGGAGTGPPPCQFRDLKSNFSNLVVTGERPTRTTTTTAASADPSTSKPGESVKYSAAVSATSGTATPTGTVDFTVGSTVLCTAPLSPSGVASCSATNTPVGNNTVKATYPGEGPFAGSSGTTSQLVAAATVSGTVLSQAGAQPVPGVQINVSDATGVQATGTTDGSGSYETGPLPAGDYTVTPQNNPEQYSPPSQHVTIDQAAVTANFTHNLHLDQLSPVTGSPAGGQQITLTGYGFGPAGGSAEVRFDSTRFATTATDVKVLSDTQITATIPREDRQKGDPDQAPITVAIGGARSNAVEFTYAMHVDSITPNAGSPAGGTHVTITGSGFGPAGNNADQVIFALDTSQANPPPEGRQVPASDVHVVSDTEITATTPAESDQTGYRPVVSVNVNEYRSNSVKFTFRAIIKSISPPSASPAGGQRITIMGEGFGNGRRSSPFFGHDAVDFYPAHTKSATRREATDVVVVSDTVITATVPSVVGDYFESSGPDQESKVDVSIMDNRSNFLPFRHRVHLHSVRPDRSSPAGGPITIRGHGFGPAGNHQVEVRWRSGEFAINSATDLRVVSDTEITARIPSQDVLAKSGKLRLYVIIGVVLSDNKLLFTYNRGKPKIAARTAAVSDDAVALKIACSGGGPCRGTDTIIAVGAQAARITRGHPRSAVIASGRYSMKAGRSATVRIRLTSAGRRLLKKHHGTLRTTLKITPVDSKRFSKSLILKQIKALKHR